MIDQLVSQVGSEATGNAISLGKRIAYGFAGGASYGILFYARKRFDPGQDTTFDPLRLAITVFLAGAIATVLPIIGIEPTRANIFYLITAYAGIVAMLEAAVKAVLRGNYQRSQSILSDIPARFLGSSVQQGMGPSKHQTAQAINRQTQDYQSMTDKQQENQWEGNYPEQLAQKQRSERRMAEKQDKPQADQQDTEINQDNEVEPEDTEESDVGESDFDPAINRLSEDAQSQTTDGSCLQESIDSDETTG